MKRRFINTLPINERDFIAKELFKNVIIEFLNNSLAMKVFQQFTISSKSKLEGGTKFIGLLVCK